MDTLPLPIANDEKNLGPIMPVEVLHLSMTYTTHEVHKIMMSLGHFPILSNVRAPKVKWASAWLKGQKEGWQGIAAGKPGRT